MEYLFKKSGYSVTPIKILCIEFLVEKKFEVAALEIIVDYCIVLVIHPGLFKFSVRCFHIVRCGGGKKKKNVCPAHTECINQHGFRFCDCRQGLIFKDRKCIGRMAARMFLKIMPDTRFSFHGRTLFTLRDL